MLAVVTTATASAQTTHDTTDPYVLAILIEGNRPAVIRAIAEEYGTVVLDIEETGTLRVAFDLDSHEDLLEVQRRLRARGITAIVPGPGVPLTPR
jgi:hypothetical protein